MNNFVNDVNNKRDVKVDYIIVKSLNHGVVNNIKNGYAADVVGDNADRFNKESLFLILIVDIGLFINFPLLSCALAFILALDETTPLSATPMVSDKPATVDMDCI